MDLTLAYSLSVIYDQTAPKPGIYYPLLLSVRQHYITLHCSSQFAKQHCATIAVKSSLTHAKHQVALQCLKSFSHSVLKTFSFPFTSAEGSLDVFVHIVVPFFSFKNILDYRLYYMSATPHIYCRGKGLQVWNYRLWICLLLFSLWQSSFVFGFFFSSIQISHLVITLYYLLFEFLTTNRYSLARSR